MEENDKDIPKEIFDSLLRISAWAKAGGEERACLCMVSDHDAGCLGQIVGSYEMIGATLHAVGIRNKGVAQQLFLSTLFTMLRMNGVEFTMNVFSAGVEAFVEQFGEGKANGK
jgi:hypothetical protein